MPTLKNDVRKSTLGHNSRPIFWSPFEALNNVSVPDNQAIKLYQIKKLEEFQKQAINKNERKIEEINKLFEEGNINILSNYEQDKDIQLNKSLTNIVDRFQNLRDLKEDNYLIDNYNQIKRELNLLYNFLINLKKQLNIKSVIYDKDLNFLTAVMNRLNLKSFDDGVIERWFKNLNILQGNFVEEVGTAWLNQRIPTDLDVKAYTTGSLHYTGGKHGSAGQIIQDILLLDTTKIDLKKDIQINYKLNKKLYNCTLEEFLQFITKYQGQKNIVIEDDLYEILLELTTLNFQAKSGFDQLPWNKNSQNTKVAIQDYKNDASATLIQSVSHVFELLKGLQESPPKDKWLINNSVNYNALANYGLATVLNKVLHLSEKENQYLLTPSGFISYPTRAKELLKKENTIFKLVGQVTLEDNVLSKMRTVTITGY